MSPLSLGWGRSPDGRFLLAVTAGAGAGAVPVFLFYLSPAEEQGLRGALGGIVVEPAPLLRIVPGSEVSLRKAD